MSKHTIEKNGGKFVQRYGFESRNQQKEDVFRFFFFFMFFSKDIFITLT